jgi:hypothetical protein
MALLTREATSPLTTITREEIRDLLHLPGKPCVSIYMPIVRAGLEAQQNPIRLKNLLRSVQEKLAESGMKKTDAAELLTPVRGLVEDPSFWQQQGDGLAVFRSPEVFQTHRLPIEVGELALVENRFHLKPLFSLLAENARFYILALSRQNIRLIAATRHRAEELEIPGVPQSLEEALGPLIERYLEASHQAGTAASTGVRSVSVGRTPFFHGMGAGENHVKTEILQFFNLADKALLKSMDRDVPVVLAGVEYLLPFYKETTEHPRVLDEGLTGNAENLSPEELRDKAWGIVEPVFTADRRKAAERYGDLMGSGRSSSRPEEILPAAHDGRIDTLFVARGVRLWGTYDVEKREVRLQAEQNVHRNGSEDLLDLAAVQTFLNSGKVYAVPRQDVPGGQAMAAIFRY